MLNVSSSKVTSRAASFCALALLFAAVCATARAQVSPPDASGHASRPRQHQTAQRDDDADDDDEGESESVSARVSAHGPATDPATVLRKARFVMVRSDSVFISGREVEDSLRKRKEFRAWGMVVTRDAGQADLIIEITRKSFTRRYTFTVIDPRTSEVVTSGKTRSVIFGKKIANKVAEKFANRVKVYRPYPPDASNP